MVVKPFYEKKKESFLRKQESSKEKFINHNIPKSTIGTKEFADVFILNYDENNFYYDKMIRMIYMIFVLEIEINHRLLVHHCWSRQKTKITVKQILLIP